MYELKILWNKSTVFTDSYVHSHNYNFSLPFSLDFMQTVNTLCQNTSKECPAVYGRLILEYVILNFTHEWKSS
jgi:hypothetical protein